MSKVAIQGNPSGSGVLTLAAPDTSTDRTLTLPDSAGTIATAESTLAQFNASGSAPVYACRAWVNFGGTGTPAIRASGNVSSITDNGTADYTVNFTTAMPDANYSVIGLAGNNTTSLACVCQPRNLSAPTTSAVRLQAVRADGVLDVDPPVVCVSVFR
jgi:hypothetical protein